MSVLIAADAGLTLAGSGDDPEIAGIASDSRGVKMGYLFAALPGARADGRAFLADALARGAVAVLAPPGTPAPARTTLIESANPRRSLALLAARFHGPQPRHVVAVTGTNGKTSVASFARQIWGLLGLRAASLGTLGLVAPERARPGSLTTPDPVALHRDLAELAREGVEHVALEASSHGLDQFRLDGVQLAAGAFTNLTRDHLDYHASMAAYYAAKRRLFDTLLPAGAAAVLNADAPEFADLDALCRRRGLRVLSYGAAGRELRLISARPSPAGIALEAEALGARAQATLPLVGAFQAANALAALGLAVGCGAEPGAALACLARLEAVPGRLQRAAVRHNGAAVYVDYAHTPDALETILRALRPHARGRLVVAFGCGGDRDSGKRPLMGAIAARLADRVYVTDDNPRSEDPASIRAQILAAAPGAIEVGARAEAIASAVAGLGPGDLLVVAGKGHEQGQVVGDRVLPFDDVAVAREAVVASDRGAP